MKLCSLFSAFKVSAAAVVTMAAAVSSGSVIALISLSPYSSEDLPLVKGSSKFGHDV
jgi:hypothetical protein